MMKYMNYIQHNQTNIIAYINGKYNCINKYIAKNMLKINNLKFINILYN